MYFDLGGGVKFSVNTFNLVQKAYKPPKVRLARDNNEEVRTQRTFTNPTTGAPLLPSEINKYQEYGGERITMTQEEVKSIVSLDGNVGLRLIGFKPIDSLKFGHYVRSGYFIYPEEKVIKGSRTIFAALLIKCLEKKVMAICSFKPRDSSGPSFVALVPQEHDPSEGKASGFHLIFLPFADDIRSVPDVKMVEPEPEQIDAAKKVNLLESF